MESGIQCGVEAMQRMPSTPGFSNVTMFNFDNSTVIGSMVTGFQKSTGACEDLGQSTVAEIYIQDPADVLVDGLRQFANLSTVPIELFQERLGLLLNTFFRSNIHFESYFGRQLQYVYTWDQLLNVSALTTTPLPPVYEISRPWTTVYLFAVIIMFLATVFTIVLRRRCSAPQILGYVSSLVRDSTHFAEAGLVGHSAESGMEIAARLRRVRVSVADLKAGQTVGKIAFVPPSKGKRIKTRRLWCLLNFTRVS